MKKIAAFLIITALFLYGISVGEIAPNFVLKDLKGKTWKLTDLKGKVVLLVFFSVHCPHCKKELPAVNNLFLKYANDGLMVLGISVDMEGFEPVEKIRRELKIDFPLLVDEKGVFFAYEVSGVPKNVLIDRKGKIFDISEGYSEGEEEIIEKKILKLLKSNK